MRDIINIFMTFALSLGLTLLIEIALGLAVGLRGRDLILLVLLNILTNPAVVYLNMLFSELLTVSRFAWQLPLEATAIITEGALYQGLGEKISHPWLFAIAANVISYSLGLLINLIL